MEVLSVNDVKRIDFVTMDKDICKPCKPALEIVRQTAKKHGIKVNIKKGTVAPVACVVRDKNGVEVSDCIEGYTSDYKNDIEKLLKH